ncbi:M14 family metallopeptidase [Alicyclobacillus sp. ALC3]|uniref:M14 family metallopeptidase n=1 Tax=Alicyclobacillus sp. ALC3 TaxID=2796143 RepID=UPI0023780591|nr:M14 family metallopeptidase [Alicyclobacillus sp. ALC3]WDL98426.1 succinylglutamate desuccinylase/aspartoacylase family protein [Alicyclobacillus sp. ALC3]
MGDWTLQSVTAARGQKAHGHVYAPGLSSPLPVFLIHGVEDGPTVVVQGGIHGCEYTSVDAALQIGRKLQPEQVKGRVLVLPIANPDSFYARSIYVHPLDNKNLNRQFPGDATGTASQQLARFLFEEAYSQADALLDLHGGDMIEALVPFSIYTVSGNEELDTKAREMADVFGIKYVIADTGQVMGATDSAMAQAGKLAVIAEAGQQGILSSEWSQQLQDGVWNVLRWLGVIEGDVKPTETQLLHEFDWYRAEEAGLWYPSIGIGEKVKAGQEIGCICDEFGEPLHRYHAKADGTALFIVTSLAINRNDPLLALGDAE